MKKKSIHGRVIWQSGIIIIYMWSNLSLMITSGCTTQALLIHVLVTTNQGSNELLQWCWRPPVFTDDLSGNQFLRSKQQSFKTGSTRCENISNANTNHTLSRSLPQMLRHTEYRQLVSCSEMNEETKDDYTLLNGSVLKKNASCIANILDIYTIDWLIDWLIG